MGPSSDGGGSAGGQGGPLGGLMSFLPLIAIFAIFYFLIIRPQQKQAKSHREMIDTLKRGDKVVTGGGIHGLVEQVDDKTVTLKIAENVKVRFDKSTIARLRGADEE